MELNITLVIQAINFLCAYLIMRYGLFTPAIIGAVEDKEHTASLISAITDRKIILEQKFLEKKENWKTYQYQLAKYEPSPRLVQEIFVPHEGPVLQAPNISDSVATQAMRDSVEIIVQKIGDLS